MKKRNQPTPERLVPSEIMERARKSVETDRTVHPPKRCAVCDSPYTPMSGPQQSEDLCWVCKRLKISAWRDVDQQAAVQE
jgi:hypothetical protein